MAALPTNPEQAPRPVKQEREDSGVAVDVEQIWQLYWEATDAASPCTVLPPPTEMDLPELPIQASASTTTLARSGAVRRVRPISESELEEIWTDAQEIQLPVPVSVQAAASAPTIMQTTLEQEPSVTTDPSPPTLLVAPAQPSGSISDQDTQPIVPDAGTPAPKSKTQSFRSTLATRAHILYNALLRRSILYDKTNLIATDPAAVDVLLVCISAVSDVRRTRRMIPFDLLPGCPISSSSVKKSIDKLPELSCLLPPSVFSKTPLPDQTTASVRTLKNEHVRLLTWLLSSPISVLASVTPSLNPHLHLPSLLPLGIRAFAVTRQPGNKEARFAKHAAAGTPFPVFHGTSPARLPLILSQGLRNMSGTRFQAHGKAMGPGIYLGGDPATSLSYSYATPVWKGSQFRGPWVPGTTNGFERMENADVLSKKILLGCELAGEVRGRGTYVIAEEDKVCVRFVFLVPGGWCGEGYEDGFKKELEDMLVDMRGKKVRG